MKLMLISVMASYNEIWCVPSHANELVINDVLRGWMGGLKGFVVSAY